MELFGSAKCSCFGGSILGSNAPFSEIMLFSPKKPKVCQNLENAKYPPNLVNPTVGVSPVLPLFALYTIFFLSCFVRFRITKFPKVASAQIFEKLFTFI